MTDIDPCPECEGNCHDRCSNLGWMRDAGKFTTCPCAKAGHQS